MLQRDATGYVAEAGTQYFVGEMETRAAEDVWVSAVKQYVIDKRQRGKQEISRRPPVNLAPQVSLMPNHQSAVRPPNN